jgi:hypothetical protein
MMGIKERAFGPLPPVTVDGGKARIILAAFCCGTHAFAGSCARTR